MNNWEIVCATLSKVERTRSRIEKQMHLRSCTAKDELKQLLQLTYDFHNLYGITLDEHGKCTDYEPKFSEFITGIEGLRNRDPVARVWIRELFLAHPCKWFARVINHDLRCGLGIKTINFVFLKLIPEFSIALCEPFDSRIELYKTTWSIETKYDGIRGLVGQFDRTHTSTLSRNGKELFNTQRVLEVVDKLKNVYPELRMVVLDGEFVAEDWNKTVSTLHTQSEIPGSDKLKFMVFDAIDLSTFPYDPRPLEERRQVLDELKEYLLPESPIDIVQHVETTNLDQAWQIARGLHEKGYEGAIIKNVSAPYKPARTDQWTKLKFYHEVDAEIIGAYEGQGNIAGSLGGITVTYGRYTTNVGSGFNYEDRKRLWQLHQEGKLVGLKAQLTYQELTESSFRFPIYMRLRTDK